MASVSGSPPYFFAAHTTSSSSTSRHGGFTTASQDGVPSSDANSTNFEAQVAGASQAADLELRKADNLARNAPLSSSYSRSMYVPLPLESILPD